MRWTNAEIAAHMFASVTEASKAARGEPSLYDAAGPTVALDEQMVAQVTERDPALLAEMIAERTAAFLAAVRGRSGIELLAAPRTTLATSVGLLAIDHHLHGGQFAETSGLPWAGRVADLHSALSTVLPYAFSPDAARDFRGSFTLQLRGVEPVRFAVEGQRLRTGVTGPTDCIITADPQTFLRVGIGVVSQLRAALTGKMRAGGRKPWLARALPRLFPPIPHGGVATWRR